MVSVDPRARRRRREYHDLRLTHPRTRAGGIRCSGRASSDPGNSPTQQNCAKVAKSAKRSGRLCSPLLLARLGVAWRPWRENSSEERRAIYATVTVPPPVIALLVSSDSAIVFDGSTVPPSV